MGRGERLEVDSDTSGWWFNQWCTHSSTFAWEIPWTEEPGRLQSMGSQRVGHDWATSLSLFIFMLWRRKWQPTPVFLPGESQGREPAGPLSTGSHRVGHDWSDLAVYNEASIETRKDGVLRVSELGNTCRLGESDAPGERMEPFYPFPTPCPVHLFQLFVPELYLFTVNRWSSK